ncbi:MAG: MFS transporter [Bacteroidales bacterium]|nr:MFS transporter [Bacteroidales bacterium]
MAEEEKQNRVSFWKDRNLHIIFSITLMAVMGVSSITPVFPDVKDAFGISEQQVGLLITVFTLPGIVLTPLLGVLADRYGRKTILVPSLLLFGVAGTACFFTTDYTWLLFFRFLQGSGAASLGSLNGTLIGDIYPDEQRATVMGYNGSVLSMGTASYPAIGGLLALLGWHFPFALPVLALPIAFVVLYKLDNPEPRNGQNFIEYLKNALSYINNKTVIILFLNSLITFIILFGSYLTYFPFLMGNDFQAESWVIGVLMSVTSVSTAITSSQLGRLTGHFGERKLIIIGFLLYTISLILIPLTPSIWLMPIPVLIFGFAQGINFPSVITLLMRISPMNYRGIFMSLNGMVLRIGQTLGPLLMGLTFAIWGIQGAFWAGAALTLMMFLFLVFLIRR